MKLNPFWFRIEEVSAKQERGQFTPTALGLRRQTPKDKHNQRVSLSINGFNNKPLSYLVRFYAVPLKLFAPSLP
jgi:hypothetical protein